MRKKPMHPPNESTATFLRDHLLRVKRDYPYSMWSLWRKHLKKLNMKYPSFDSFRHYIWVLKKAGLIQRVESSETEPKVVGSLKPRRRSYYALVQKNMTNLKAWANPQAFVYGETLRYGARKYRRKVLGLPPKKRGRPKKDTYVDIKDRYSIPT